MGLVKACSPLRTVLNLALMSEKDRARQTKANKKTTFMINIMIFLLVYDVIGIKIYRE